MPGSGRTRQHQEAIQRFFEGLEVVEAKESLRVFTNEADAANATKKNPRECVFAQSCKRIYGSSAILFFRSIAYVDLPDHNGVRKVNRFMLDKEVRERIAMFDRTGVSHPGGYLLSAPRPSSTLESGRARLKTSAKRKQGLLPPISEAKRKAVMKGLAKRTHTLSAVTSDIRNGTGMVQFVKRGK